MLGSKKGSIFNSAIVPLPLRTRLLWVSSLEAGVARSGTEHTLEDSEGKVWPAVFVNNTLQQPW